MDKIVVANDSGALPIDILAKPGQVVNGSVHINAQPNEEYKYAVVNLKTFPNEDEIVWIKATGPEAIQFDEDHYDGNTSLGLIVRTVNGTQPPFSIPISSHGNVKCNTHPPRWSGYTKPIGMPTRQPATGTESCNAWKFLPNYIFYLGVLIIFYVWWNSPKGQKAKTNFKLGLRKSRDGINTRTERLLSSIRSSGSNRSNLPLTRAGALD